MMKKNKDKTSRYGLEIMAQLFLGKDDPETVNALEELTKMSESERENLLDLVYGTKCGFQEGEEK